MKISKCLLELPDVSLERDWLGVPISYLFNNHTFSSHLL